ASPALPARRARDAAVAAALVARGGAHHLPERRTGDDAELAAAPAPRAGLDRRTRLGAVAVAGLAQRDGVIGQLDTGSARRLRELDLHRLGDVATLKRAAGAPTRAEDVAKRARASEERLEDVGHRPEPFEVGRVA